MQSPDELRQENEALEDRISKLSAAILRISVSLDISTVLHEVVESACALTGARYGAIMIIDEAGQVQEYNSFGITPEQNRQLLAWLDGPKFFEHLRQLPGPVRRGSRRGAGARTNEFGRPRCWWLCTSVGKWPPKLSGLGAWAGGDPVPARPSLVDEEEVYCGRPVQRGGVPGSGEGVVPDKGTDRS